MNYYLILLLFITTFATVAFGGYFIILKWKAQKLAKLYNKPFKESDRVYLQKIPHYQSLSSKEQESIEHSIILFIYTKEFIGVVIDVTQEMKIVISFYACLLLLHKTTTNCYDNLQTIVIYPQAVITKHLSTTHGIYKQEEFLMDGQSANDTVVLVWHDVKQEAYHLRHNNIIIHEFAHEIDFMDGEIDGVPPIEQSKYDRWARVVFGDYQKLNEVIMKNRALGNYKLLGSYAATNEAEFFAVISERFFESPKSLKKYFPELYNELKDFYQIDTLNLLS